MRTTSCAARGRPLAALLLLILVSSLSSWAAWADAAVQVRQEIDLEEIFVAGMGEEPSRVNLTLLLRGLGPAGGYPVDCVLLVDTSATADLTTAKAFAFDLIDHFTAEDRIALVSYNTTARVDLPLTENRTGLRTAIGDLASGGKSALGLAMQMARRELLNNGREDAILVEILLADGQSNIGIEPGIEGEIASESGITIVSVGIGPLINRSLMEAFASETNGLFFQRPSEQALTEIFEHLVIDVAATDIRVEKRLPAGLRFVSASPGPSQVETLLDGTSSVIWRISELLLGQELAIEAEIEAMEEGVWDTDVDSLVTYADFRGVEGSVHVPPLMVSAIEPNRAPVAMFAYEPEGATTADIVAFTSLSFDPEEDGRIVSWEWDFGDGSVGGEQNPLHRYAESGVYAVRLRVTDNHGAVSPDVVAHVSIGDPLPPVAAFDYTPAAPTTVDPIVFIDQSFHPEEDVEIAFWGWDFGDGSISEERSPEHRYAESGTYTVRMWVIDHRGEASAVAEATISIADPPPPVAVFKYEPAKVTTADVVSFIDRSFHPEEGAEIVTWQWDFGDGAISEERNPEHRYAESGTYTVRMWVIDDRGGASAVRDMVVEISSAPPIGGFVARDPLTLIEIAQPRVGVEILLDASASYDLDGSIARYEWDLNGDGTIDTESDASDLAHTFETAGDTRVTLSVVDNEGVRATVKRTLKVMPTVSTLRTIETGLPDDWTIPDCVAHVTLNLDLNATVNGLSVTETIPVGWAFTEVENDGATIRRNGQTIEWLFLEKFVADDINSQREIHYTLSAPTTVGEMQQSTISGTAASSSPRFKQTIAGDDRVTVTPVLPITVVISRWDIVEAAVDPHLGETIGFDQIQYAVSLWLSGDVVPLTGDLTIGLATMQDLIAYWLTGSSVHDPLP
jgi:PKD repeat protein